MQTTHYQRYKNKFICFNNSRKYSIVNALSFFALLLLQFKIDLAVGIPNTTAPNQYKCFYNFKCFLTYLAI
jgi:hypothetical protein